MFYFLKINKKDKINNEENYEQIYESNVWNKK